MQSAPSKQREILNNMILHMKDEDFNACNLATSDQTLLTRNGTIVHQQTDSAPIQEDESKGIFGFF